MAARLTGDTSDDSHHAAGSHSAVPALDAEILTAVRALNQYPKRSKDKTQNLLACKIAKRWLDLLPSTREKLQALQTRGEEEVQGDMVQKLLEELRNFGRKPVEYRNTATPAQEHERLLANKFSVAKHRGKLTSSQIKELEAIWACQELLERQQEHLQRQQEHLETLKSILPDVKTRPSDSRIRELAERLKVPEQVDERSKSVQQLFHDEVCARQSKSRTMSSTNPAAKRARFATASTSSGANLAERTPDLNSEENRKTLLPCASSGQMKQRCSHCKLQMQ